MKNDELPLDPPTGADESRAPLQASAAQPGGIHEPPYWREADAREWEDLAMNAPCL